MLSKIGIIEEDLSATLSFNIEIILTNGKAFKTTADITIPVDGIVENGTTSLEIKNPDMVFKRMEN